MNDLQDLIATNGTWEFLKMQGSGTKSMAAQTVAFETGRQINTTLPDIKSSLNNIKNIYLFNPLYYGKPITNKIKTYKKDGVLCFKINDNGVRQSEVKSEVVYFFGEDETSRLNVATSILSNGDLAVKITYKGNEYLYMKFNRNGSSGWILNLNSIDSLNIPSNTPLDMVGFMTGAMWLGIQLVYGKRKSSSKNRNDEILSSPDPCPMSDGNYYISHNLLCNLPGILENMITLDGRIYIWLTCTGTLEFNVLNCCKKHDRDLWCSPTLQHAISADEEVVLCVLNEMIKQILPKVKWYCPWDYAIFWAFYVMTAGLLALIISSYTTYLHSFYLLGLGGRNLDSCLCGGKKDTYCCNPRVNPKLCCELNDKGEIIYEYPYCRLRNLCSCLDKNKIPTTGCREPCFRCHFKCVYDEYGRPVGKELVTDPSGKLSCCPGTGTLYQRDKIHCTV